jgi:hypothetical protein
MTNVGAADRLFRTLAAGMMLLAAILLTIPVMGRVGLAGMGLYLLGTALSGTCLGYRLMGKSTCPVRQGAPR